ncbi:hypothetical protein, partial [Bilophila wadsworthia]|uniref:hypothetical protein n=1 Tax=Bilophila wadsworthia TaxID=35833 RepID=UPI003AB7DF4F
EEIQSFLRHENLDDRERFMVVSYKKTGTFWEYYAPESAEPGFMARQTPWNQRTEDTGSDTDAFMPSG